MTPTRFEPPGAGRGASLREGWRGTPPPVRTCRKACEACRTWYAPAPLAMITIGCAGFPVPATRYFREFLFVEVQETHVAQPGTGSIRRWRREAPPGFVFALLAPREIGQESFREGKVTETALRSLMNVAKELDSQTAVFAAPPDF